MSKEIETLEKLIKANISGTVTKKALKDWFLEMQNKQQGLCMSLTSNQLYSLARKAGIKIVDKQSEVNGISIISTDVKIKTMKNKKIEFKFTKDEFIDLYMVKKLTQNNIAKTLKVSACTVKRAITDFGLPTRPKGKSNLDKVVLTEDLMKELYVKQNLSKEKIAKITDKTVGTVAVYITKFRLRSV